MIGKFKHETNGNPIIEFGALPRKMSSFLIDDKGDTTEKHLAKCINRCACGEITHQQSLVQL